MWRRVVVLDAWSFIAEAKSANKIAVTEVEFLARVIFAIFMSSTVVWENSNDSTCRGREKLSTASRPARLLGW